MNRQLNVYSKRSWIIYLADSQQSDKSRSERCNKPTVVLRLLFGTTTKNRAHMKLLISEKMVLKPAEVSLTNKLNSRNIPMQTSINTQIHS